MRIPSRDLAEDLINERDEELGDGASVCRASPRHLRLYVAGWMLASDDTAAGYARGLRAAVALYDCSGRALLDQKRRLTTADVVAEVLQLSAPREGQTNSNTHRAGQSLGEGPQC